ncbi:MAG: hypothetical protein Q9159_002436 [Coniocarpon cinnabarinum]
MSMPCVCAICNIEFYSHIPISDSRYWLSHACFLSYAWNLQYQADIVKSLSGNDRTDVLIPVLSDEPLQITATTSPGPSDHRRKTYRLLASKSPSRSRALSPHVFQQLGTECQLRAMACADSELLHVPVHVECLGLAERFLGHDLFDRSGHQKVHLRRRVKLVKDTLTFIDTSDASHASNPDGDTPTRDYIDKSYRFSSPAQRDDVTQYLWSNLVPVGLSFEFDGVSPAAKRMALAVSRLPFEIQSEIGTSICKDPAGISENFNGLLPPEIWRLMLTTRRGLPWLWDIDVERLE